MCTSFVQALGAQVLSGFHPSKTLGEPCGSWTIEEEDAAQSSSLNEAVTISPQQSPTSTIPEPYTVNSQIIVLDHSNLAEEVRLLASPSGSTSREIWTQRVRISPEYEIEVLPPEQQQQHSDTIPMPRHIRDSPEQRQSRYLHKIFPEIEDDLRSASRCPTDGDSTPPVLGDLEWEFPQFDLAGGDTGSAGESFVYGRQETFGHGLGLDFPSAPSMDETVSEGTESVPDTGTSRQGRGVGASLLQEIPDPKLVPTVGSETALDSSVLQVTTSPPSGSTAGGGDGASMTPIPMRATPEIVPPLGYELGLDSSSMNDAVRDGTASAPDASTADGHGHGVGASSNLIEGIMDPTFSSDSTVDDHDPPQDETESISSNSPSSPPLSEEGSSLDDDDLSTTYSSHSAPVTSISIPSTVRPSPSPSRSSAPSPFGDSDDDESNPPRRQEIAYDHQVMQTLSPVGGDQQDSKSLPSIYIRRATASISDIASGRSEAQEDGDELEYLDEYPPIVPSSPPDSFFDNAAGEQLVESHTSTPPSGDDLTAAARAPFEAAEERSLSEAVVESPQAKESPRLEDGTADIKDDENADADQTGTASTEDQSDDGWLQFQITPELPPLNLHSSSFSDEVLSSPQFHFRAETLDEGPSNPSRDEAAIAPGRHVRALSTPNIERRSILWAPHDTRDVREDAPLRRFDLKGKEKGKGRARTVSDSGFAETENDSHRVEREVQTESEAAELKAKCARLEKELRIEQAKVAELARRADTTSSERGWEARMIAKMSSWGFPSNFEDLIM
ncbi:hypothetical protein K438DRAFT_1748531 [Mycena galopus ATCC 62051]|nr:hypothetical protein K438DRAFT_1748531 [Mycena galopus ATCC 62051]